MVVSQIKLKIIMLRLLVVLPLQNPFIPLIRCTTIRYKHESLNQIETLILDGQPVIANYDISYVQSLNSNNYSVIKI